MKQLNAIEERRAFKWNLIKKLNLICESFDKKSLVQFSLFSSILSLTTLFSIEETKSFTLLFDT